MVRIIDQGIKTGNELGYSKSFPETAKVKYRHYLVGSCLEPLALPVKSDWTIQKFIAKHFSADQVEIVKE
jgi:hypothetical protein